MIDIIQIHRRFKMFGTLFACILFFNMACVELFGEQPFGSFDTPLDGSTTAGSIAVTGWALDDIGIDYVKIYREEGNGLVYIGDATFIDGARPDVAAAFPGYPNNTRAGWGYMMLSYFLPNGGNGTFTFHAIATDTDGATVTLGTKTLSIDNANQAKPFGAIDTPIQGGAASGSNFVNWGWVLTPQPNHIPTDGSTIDVYVDGINLGRPTYNIYRSDIAGLFPGYTNSNGAVGYFYLDTTAYKNGVHSIYWVARDNNGNSDGIGSRYFTINNPDAAPSLEIISPNGGENWLLGSTQIIKWKAVALSTSIEISLWKNGKWVGIIANNLAGSQGSYNWTVGNYSKGTVAAGSGFTIKIEEKGGGVFDTSDTSFSIASETWQPPRTAQEWMERPVRGAVVEIGCGGPDDIDYPPIPTAESFRDIKGLGANVVVIEFQYGWTIKPPYKVVEAQYAFLTEALDNAAAAGLYSVISVRNGPGCNAMMPGIEEPDVITTLYEDTPAGDSARTAYIKMLKNMVNRYKDREDVIAWEPLVEPCLDYYMLGGEEAPYPRASAIWNPIAESFIIAIRSVDPDRPILIEPVNWGGIDGFTLLQKFSDDNIVYSLHTYEPYLFTH
ncbi:MAG: hypothetical protein QG657_4066, partial [Acidobacteriota bacterium]|nr:hypothetical protein [Acidobacteriota bacterium]